MARTAIGILLALAALYSAFVLVRATADAIHQGGSAVLWTTLVLIACLTVALGSGAHRLLRSRA